MKAVVEFFFRPKNWIDRALAWLIRAPTCGIVRIGEAMERYGDPYETSVPFKAKDHIHAKLVGFASAPPQPSHLKAAVAAMREQGLSIGFDRRAATGAVIKTVNPVVTPKPQTPTLRKDYPMDFADLQTAVTELKATIMDGLSELDTRLDTARANIDNAQAVVDHLKAVIAGEPSENPIVEQLHDQLRDVQTSVEAKLSDLKSEVDELLAKGAAVTADAASMAPPAPASDATPAS